MIRIGTDCSGIEAPIQALIKLGMPFDHVFSSDINKHAIRSIKANYHPGRLYGDPEGEYPEGDMTKRDHSTLPDIDLYVCGFPCQPFSIAGSMKGELDPRGTVVWSCIETIKIKRPKYFILENVVGLRNNNGGKTYKTIMDELNKIPGYNIHVSVLNSKNYGVPQSRNRLWMIGTQSDNFEFPKPVPMPDVETYVDTSDTTRQVSLTAEKYKENIGNRIFVDLGFLKWVNPGRHNNYACCMCASIHMWNVPMHRHANARELLRLQGFPVDFKQVVSFPQLTKQLGNSMTVDVVAALIKSLTI
jgi:DNA (cytosine-5)-methyltransferase 1